MQFDFHRARNLTTSKLLWSIFGDGQIHHARAHFDGNAVSYRPVDAPLTPEDIDQHLQQEPTLGAYQLLPDSTVRWIAWDVDSPVIQTARNYAFTLVQFLKESAIPFAVEFSGSKGYHIFIFLEEPIPARKAMDFAKNIREMLTLPATGTDHVEVFPKQPELTATNPYGNLIKLPLGFHPRTHAVSRFVDPDNGWESGEAVDPKIVLQKLIAWEDLQVSLEPIAPENRLVAILTPVWREGDRHQLALSLSGYLAAIGWGMEQTRSLIETICEEAGDEDIKNRLDCVLDTYRKHAANKPLVGMSALRDLLPGAVVRTVVSLAGEMISPESVREMDIIRSMPKVPMYQKVRIATRRVWAFLSEEGVPIRTKNFGLYWYDNRTHEVFWLDSDIWEAFFGKQFGLNMRDGFSKQMAHDLRMEFLQNATELEVHRRSHWDRKQHKLFVHLDGKHVYVLDGETIHTEYNGECGVMFRALGQEEILPDLDDTNSDAWAHLVDDLSFTRSQDAPASPIQQREMLKAWILAFFFPEVMVTRPLLCLVGASGSGKTSAARRLLWTLEDPYGDVLELVTDKPDAMRASLSAHKLLVLDNLEKTVTPMLVDILNRVSTGADIEIRKLYTTNQTIRIKPDVFVALTAVHLPFTAETLYTRILPVELARIDKPIPEYELQIKLKTNRASIWASLLQHLNRVVGLLITTEGTKFTSTSRMADFVVFAQRLKGLPGLEYDELLAGLEALTVRQRRMMSESSPLMEVLDIWMNLPAQRDAAPPARTISELFSSLKPVAIEYRMEWKWKTARGLAQHIRAIEGELKDQYGLLIGKRYDKKTRKERNTYTFNPQEQLL